MTSSLSGLLGDVAYVRQARSRCLRCCPGVTVVALGRPSHRARGGHDLQIRRCPCGRPSLSRSVRDLGLVSPGCPGGSGSSEDCSSTWLPAWLPARAAPRLLPAVFKRVRDSLSGSVATWAFSSRAHRVTQDHPVYIPCAGETSFSILSIGEVCGATVLVLVTCVQELLVSRRRRAHGKPQLKLGFMGKTPALGAACGRGPVAAFHASQILAGGSCRAARSGRKPPRASAAQAGCPARPAGSPGLDRRQH